MRYQICWKVKKLKPRGIQPPVNAPAYLYHSSVPVSQTRAIRNTAFFRLGWAGKSLAAAQVTTQPPSSTRNPPNTFRSGNPHRQNTAQAASSSHAPARRSRLPAHRQASTVTVKKARKASD